MNMGLYLMILGNAQLEKRGLRSRDKGVFIFFWALGLIFCNLGFFLSFYGLLDFLASGSNWSSYQSGDPSPSLWRLLYMYGTYSSWRMN